MTARVYCVFGKLSLRPLDETTSWLAGQNFKDWGWHGLDHAVWEPARKSRLRHHLSSPPKRPSQFRWSRLSVDSRLLLAERFVLCLCCSISSLGGVKSFELFRKVFLFHPEHNLQHTGWKSSNSAKYPWIPSDANVKAEENQTYITIHATDQQHRIPQETSYNKLRSVHVVILLPSALNGQVVKLLKSLKRK